MKKYIFTETQIKTMVDTIINEQTIAEQLDQLLTIRDLAVMMARVYDNEESKEDSANMIHKILNRAYRQGGDEHVVELFKSGTKINIEPMGQAKYQLKY